MLDDRLFASNEILTEHGAEEERRHADTPTRRSFVTLPHGRTWRFESRIHPTRLPKLWYLVLPVSVFHSPQSNLLRYHCILRHGKKEEGRPLWPA